MPLWRRREHQVFLFSPDGAEWSVQDLAEVAGEEIQASDLLVVDDRVVALVSEGPAYSLDHRPLPTVPVWTALVP